MAAARGGPSMLRSHSLSHLGNVDYFSLKSSSPLLPNGLRLPALLNRQQQQPPPLNRLRSSPTQVLPAPTSSDCHNDLPGTSHAAHHEDLSSTSECSSSEPVIEAAGGIAVEHSNASISRAFRSDSGLLLAPGGAVFMNRRDVQQRYTDECITVFCSTWNLAGKVPDMATIKHWLRETLTDGQQVDIYAVSMQEVHSYHMCFHHDITIRIGETLGSKFTPFLWVRKFGQMLVVYIRKTLVPFCTDPDWEFIPSTVVAKPARTKGAIAVGFRVLHTAVLFIGCHLSHRNKGDRVCDYHKISQCLQFSRYIRRTGYSAVASFDRVFWFGDLNFRVYDKAAIAALIKGQGAVQVQDALRHDQLGVEMLQGWPQGTVFERFCEGDIRFQPTYKYVIGSSDYSDKRSPAYTDRILYRSNHQTAAQQRESIRVLQYDSMPEVLLSDHKPVFALFKVSLLHASKPS